jgi:hypothetical protein
MPWPGSATVADAEVVTHGHVPAELVESPATTMREAVDQLQDRLRHRLSRMALHWEARRGRTWRSTR